MADASTTYDVGVKFRTDGVPESIAVVNRYAQALERTQKSVQGMMKSTDATVIAKHWSEVEKSTLAAEAALKAYQEAQQVAAKEIEATPEAGRGEAAEKHRANLANKLLDYQKKIGVALQAQTKMEEHIERAEWARLTLTQKLFKVIKDTASQFQNYDQKLIQIAKEEMVKMVTHLASPATWLAWAAKGARYLKAAFMEGWNLADQIDDANDRMTGLLFTTLRFKKALSVEDQFDQAKKGAEALRSTFGQIADRVAMSRQAIDQLAQRVEPILARQGKTLRDVAKATEDVAAASKVLGVSAEQFWGSIYRSSKTGRAGRNDELAEMLLARAGIKPGKQGKVNAEENLEKLLKVAREIGAPVEKIASDTGDMMQRWRNFSERIMHAMVLPVFIRVGQLMGRIVATAQEWEEPIKKAAFWVGNVLATLLDAAEAVWDLVVNVGKAGGGFERLWVVVRAVGEAFDVVLRSAQFLVLVIRLAAAGWEAIFDPNKAIPKIDAIMSALWLKFMQFAAAMRNLLLDILEAFFNMWTFGLFDISKKMRKMAEESVFGGKTLDNAITAQDKYVASLEKKLGIDLGSDAGRGADQLFPDKDALDKQLAEIFGNKVPTVHIDNVNIQQDFRDQDPDRVMIEFVSDLTNLSQRALSASSSSPLVHGPA